MTAMPQTVATHWRVVYHLRWNSTSPKAPVHTLQESVEIVMRKPPFSHEGRSCSSQNWRKTARTCVQDGYRSEVRAGAKKTRPPVLKRRRCSHHKTPFVSCVCFCVHASCVRAFVRACVRACMHACVRACARAFVHACVRTCGRM